MSSRILSRVMLLCGAAVLLAALLVVLLGRTAQPVILTQPMGATTQARAFLEELKAGDLSAAGQRIWGKPRMEQPEFDAQYIAALWDDYWQNFDYTWQGECYATDAGICRKVTLSLLDVPQMIAAIETQCAEKRTAGLSAAEALDQAAAQVLAQPERPVVSRELTLTLVCRDGQWQIVPDSALNDVLCGGFDGKEH